jgi:hypothetical protein
VIAEAALENRTFYRKAALRLADTLRERLTKKYVVH